MTPGEVTPGIASTEYVQRRQTLAAALPPGSVALFPSVPLSYMSHDVPFPYHQETDLVYLSGLLEPSSMLACVRPPEAASPARWHLFVRPANPKEEMWDGARAGVQGAQSFFLPDGAAHPIDQAPTVLASELRGGGVRHLYYSPELNPQLDAQLRPALQQSAEAGLMKTHSSTRLAHQMRVCKSAAELRLMRRSGHVGAFAMNATMCGSLQATRSGLTEHALAAHFEFEIKLNGAERLAYPCVVASGSNAVTLHYMHNNALLRDDSLMLMDAGSSVHGYCSDVTRTWPLGGTFSPAQRALYEAVLSVNERCIAHCKADGTTSLNALHRLSMQWTFDALVDLGVLKRSDPRAGQKCQRYYPHAIGHWLGLDVHDTPSIDSGRPLEPGMVITVEPGLYIPLDDEDAPAWARGIGIRIEDDVHVTTGHAEVLTSDAPKRVEELEAMLAGRAASGVGTAQAAASNS